MFTGLDMFISFSLRASDPVTQTIHNMQVLIYAVNHIIGC